MLDKTTLVCVVIGATLSTARAQPDPSSEPAASTTASADGVDQLTLPKGRVLLDAFVEMNLSSGAALKPFSLSPDVWYGATDELTVGLVHSALAGSGFIGGVGTSLCLAGTENGCPDVYPGFGIDARYRMKPQADIAWAVDGGVFVRAFDPFQLALKLGVAGRWHKDKLAVEALPNVFVGLTNRTPEAGMVVVSSNEETLNLPVTALYSVIPKAVVALQLGLVLPFQNTGDTYAVPLSVGGHYQATADLNVNLAFSLPRLVGGGEQTGVDARTLTLGGTYAF